MAGYEYSVKGPIQLCEWGLHASERAIDALQYAPGHMIGRVVLSGEVIRGNDKLVATHREYLWIADAEETLRNFARWSALQVIHLWDAPEIVRRYLESGDESLRDAARNAAWDVAWGAARDAARDAAWAAAWDVARAPARGPARDAARDVAWDAAWDAAWGAARDVARGAARDAARDAAWDAARDDQSTELEKRLMSLGGSK